MEPEKEMSWIWIPIALNPVKWMACVTVSPLPREAFVAGVKQPDGVFFGVRKFVTCQT
jgi:hypothetical protein